MPVSLLAAPKESRRHDLRDVVDRQAVLSWLGIVLYTGIFWLGAFYWLFQGSLLPN
ncbi:hypothetical protein [Microvirga pudoricolor]|uniref:hypothetical protein n=1 Tax=Microvirga pudoricolor TaxID=2778729 RepID=UPI00194EA77B|nr:hypothetical protein [Microvirga pudoricolor]MBM6595695.1 hypothetical protein [Microvirga pudoricolor]